MKSLREYMNIILFEATAQSLFRQYGGKVFTFDQLPDSAQKSLHNYLGDYNDEAEYTKESYGYVMIPAKVLAKFCWDAPDNDMRDNFPSWNKYAKDYWEGEDDASYAGHLVEMWPVILNDGEGILDGWHRMHWYLRNGVEAIPAILTL
jgi:hypothetical protein